jgi:serine/threonine protein kinase
VTDFSQSFTKEALKPSKCVVNEYSAPELKNNEAKRRSDVYSLGLILFELAFPIKNEKEKNLKFEEMKKGIFPQTLCHFYPVIAKLLELTLSEDYKKRPTIRQLLAFITDYLRKSRINENDRTLGRKRIFSEDNESEKKFEILINLDERNENWQEM